MKVVVTLDDIRAYAEVDYIIHHMNERYIEKLPLKLVEFFDNFKDPDWDVYVNPKIPLQSQGLLKYTLEIIAVLHVKYWCENEQRKNELLHIMQENQNRSEEALKAQYNVENIFSTQSVTNIVSEDGTSTILEENEAMDFSKPRKATIINNTYVPQNTVQQPKKLHKLEKQPKEEKKPETQEEEAFKMPENFRQTINGKDEFTATDIINSSIGIDRMPIETDKQKQNGLWHRIVRWFSNLGKKNKTEENNESNENKK